MMSGIEKIKHILDKEVHTVLKRRKVSLASNDNGIVDELELKIAKAMLLLDATTDLESLVLVKEGYPSKDSREVDIMADLVVLDGRDYREILELLENGIT